MVMMMMTNDDNDDEANDDDDDNDKNITQNRMISKSHAKNIGIIFHSKYKHNFKA